MRTVDEQGRLDNFCRIVCDRTDYSQVRAGYVEHDDAKTVRIVSWAWLRGFRSILALPLKEEGGQLFGVFVICSAAINAFNREEIRLQEELSGELAFGISILVPPGREDEIPRILDRSRSGEPIKHHEAVRRRKDRQEIPFPPTIAPVYGPQGKVLAASAGGRDITEKARVEEGHLR
jgi:PAS domain-containing protein